MHLTADTKYNVRLYNYVMIHFLWNNTISGNMGQMAHGWIHPISNMEIELYLIIYISNMDISKKKNWQWTLEEQNLYH